MTGDIGRRVLPDAGSYSIEVFSDGPATGLYSLTLHRVPPPTTTPIEFDVPIEGTIAEIGEWHEYTFLATAGQTVYLESLTDPSSRLLWRLYGPNGFMGVGSMPGDLQVALRDGGSYRIEVFSDETDTGRFGFEVHAVPVVPARAIEIGETVSGTIGAVGERHEYTFAVAEGAAIAPDGRRRMCRGPGVAPPRVRRPGSRAGTHLPRPRATNARGRLVHARGGEPGHSHR